MIPLQNFPSKENLLPPPISPLDNIETKLNVNGEDTLAEKKSE